MRRVALLAVTGCWTAAPPPAPPVTPKPASCEIRDRDIELAGALRLSVRETEFAAITGDVQSIHVRVDPASGQRGDRELHARIETAQLVVEGLLDPEHTFVRPREPVLHDGWLVVERATIRDPRGSSVHLVAPLDDGWLPAGIGLEWPCDQLTVAGPAAYEAPADAPAIELDTEHAVTVRRTPGGPIVATLSPQDDPEWPRESSGYELSRKDGWVEVRIDGTNPIVGWVDAAAVTGQRGGIFGGLLGSEHVANQVSCGRPVPILVRVDNAVIEVGHFKPRANIGVDPDDGAELPVLDGAFVRRADLAGCRRR